LRYFSSNKTFIYEGYSLYQKMNDDFSESGHEDEVLSDESETFNEIMKIYQKEIKNKKSYRVSS